jgi:hypothetical protein
MIQEAVLSGSVLGIESASKHKIGYNDHLRSGPRRLGFKKWNAGYMWSIPTQSLWLSAREKKAIKK